MIPFNKPYLSGNELEYIRDAVISGKISGNGTYTKKCHDFFIKKYNFSKVLLTSSCTDALEMTAILLDIKEGDEVIAPSYTFVSSVNAFILRGAKIVFCDSNSNNPNIDENLIESLITVKTKAIVLVHYAGIACNMSKILSISKQYNIPVIEDAAQAIDSYYNKKPLGSFGAMSAFSFHETKNIISGEGGLLVINDEKYFDRAEIVWEKGTNRSAFFRGEIDKYGWVDIGSSFLPSEIIAAYLYAQIESMDRIQERRIHLWCKYYEGLMPLQEKGMVTLPAIPLYATNNGHMFYLICSSVDERTTLIEFLRKHEVHAVFHYISLYSSVYYMEKHNGSILPNSDRYSQCLLRLPLFYELSDIQCDYIIEKIVEFYKTVI